MNDLNPELKRLIRWARRAPQPPVPEAPFGFSTRVTARWLAEPGDAGAEFWRRAVSLSAWVSTAIILCGLAFLLNQKRRGESAYDFTPAYQVAAQSIVP